MSPMEAQSGLDNIKRDVSSRASKQAKDLERATCYTCSSLGCSAVFKTRQELDGHCADKHNEYIEVLTARCGDLPADKVHMLSRKNIPPYVTKFGKMHHQVAQKIQRRAEQIVQYIKKSSEFFHTQIRGHDSGRSHSLRVQKSKEFDDLEKFARRELLRPALLKTFNCISVTQDKGLETESVAKIVRGSAAGFFNDQQQNYRRFTGTFALGLGFWRFSGTSPPLFLSPCIDLRVC